MGTASLMKLRLGRLLGLKSSRFRKQSPSLTDVDVAVDSNDGIRQVISSSIEPFPHIHRNISTAVSDSSDDESFLTISTVSNSSTCASLTSNSHYQYSKGHGINSSKEHQYDDHSCYYPSGIDPYADVRDRMEELSYRDRQRFTVNNYYDSNAALKQPKHKPVHVDHIPGIVAYFVYISYAVLIFMGHVRDFFAVVFQHGRYLRRKTGVPSDNIQMYAPLLKSWENFFTRRLYSRIQDVFNRPISSNPGAVITVLERVSDDERKSMKLLGPISNLDTLQQKREYERGEHFTLSYDGSVARQCLNLGSYNYLGFGDDWQVSCAKDVKGSLNKFSVSGGSCRNEYGTSALHRELERTVAAFLGKEDALVLNMGFNTNATTIPSLVGRGDLILSDELNHTSIVNGARASGAAIRTFRHNDIENLEAVLREAVVMGRPRSRRIWNKILVIVEGIYSMEGEYCDLKNVVRICKRYGAYVYLDEAHSIGAMGPTGRGLSEFTGTDTADIDIMMGTFTKSFGGMGGYIAADKGTIDFLRQRCSASVYHNALSPVVCQQVLTCFKVISGQDGTTIGQTKLHALRDNSNYFRMRLREMGLQVLGQYDSPIMPVMLYHPGKISGFSRECFKRGLAVVVVGFPAVPLLMSRARFCISAGHTRPFLDRALKEIDEIATILHLRYQPENPDLIQ
jgi:serine palmitoyltransferase